MAQAMAAAAASELVTLKRPFQSDGFGDENGGADEKPRDRRRERESDPAAALAAARHEFGEHGGVNMSIEASATFTVMEPDTMRCLFAGELGPDRGDMYIYSRHFNPTVLALGRQMAALEGTEAAYCTASGMSAISSALAGTWWRRGACTAAPTRCCPGSCPAPPGCARRSWTPTTRPPCSPRWCRGRRGWCTWRRCRTRRWPSPTSRCWRGWRTTPAPSW